MANVTISEPDLVETKTVDKQGRVYLKSDLAEKTVRVAVEVLDDE